MLLPSPFEIIRTSTREVNGTDSPSTNEVQKLLDGLMVSVNRGRGASFSSDGRVADDKTEPELMANIEALQEILASCARQTQEAIARLNHRRNSFLPLHQLSMEILGRTIYLAIRLDSEPFPKRLSTLSTVCKRWNTAIQTSPQFWSVLDCRTRSSTVQYFLNRSVNAPLFVNCDMRPHGSNVGWFLDVVRPHSARWESLDYCGSAHSLGEVATVFDSPTPILADLYVYSTEFDLAKRGVAQPQFTLSEGRRLRDVHLRAATLSYDSPRLASLRSLQLTWLSSPPSVAELSEIILQSPRLDSLVLAHFFPTATMALAASNTSLASSILLSELINLEMLDIPQPYFFELLARLEAPRCARVRLGDQPKLEPQDVPRPNHLLESGILDSKYHAVRSTLRATLLSAQAVLVTVFKDHTVIAADFLPGPAHQRRVAVTQEVPVGRGGWRGRGRGRGRGGFTTSRVFRDGWKAKPPPLLLTITPQPQKRSIDCLPALGELLRSTGVVAPVILTVKADGDEMAEFPANTFSGFTTLKELNIDGLAAFRAAAKELGQLQGTNPEELEWACPQLTEMHIRFGGRQRLAQEEAALMVGWLRDRWGTPTDKTKAPSPLTQLHFVNRASDPEERWKSALQECQELLPVILNGFDTSGWDLYRCPCKKFA
ncbi:hypothetical protein FRC04_010238 [Tulasnella sp. 424]|nr:hypothetical protein FRC04_010238 [Tulasnella sp. 424]KAG8972089.1 hypothetical protein FRC05_010381 [Tulasnella sp. 425]